GGCVEAAGLVSIGITNGSNVEALHQPTMGNVLGQFLDGDAVFDATHIFLRQRDLVEGNVLCRVESDLLNGLCHIVSPWPAGQSLSPTAKPATKAPSSLSL